jgi:phage-related protein
MVSTTEKTAKTNHIAPKKADGNCFFRKAEEPSFFQSNDKPAFFGGVAVQPKLSVSTPDDPHEKEADQVADQVMRMPEPVAAPVNTNPQQGEDLQRKEEEEHTVHPKLETPSITSLQCKQQGTIISPRLMPFVQRSSNSDEFVSDNSDTAPSGQHSEGHLSLKSLPLCRSPGQAESNRGPPATSSSFESSLSSSKGNGSALPSDTMASMNSRFNTDFSGVRIHTGATAETLSSSINAQAFTHGSDIYFNTGKFQPGTDSGGLLLAHELTHTIQQGSVSQPAQGSAVSRKPIIQRQAHDRPVPSQLNNAVAKAKGEVGKVNANEAGPDGFRTGWQRLVEYFKTTLGQDKVVAEGQPGSQGAVSEGDIKKERKIDNALPPANPRPAAGPYVRDAMPSWCGIFAFWSLHKGGVPLRRWEIGGPPAVDVNAAYPPGYIPKAGDIAYRNAFSHYALVEKATGDTVTTINGNTSGENNLGAQIQVKDHPLKSWTAFFDPLMLMNGQLGSGDTAAEEKPKTLREMRQQLFHVNRKEDADHSEAESAGDSAETQVHAKPELSNWSVNPTGALTHSPPAIPAVQAKEEPGHHEDDLQENEAQHEPRSHEIQRKQDGEDAHNEPQGADVQFKADRKIQCSWFDSALSVINSAVDYVAKGLEAGKEFLLNQARDFAMAIPGYMALRVVLGEDPITNQQVERNGHNFIEAAFDIMPGGRLLHQKLEELGALRTAEAWVDTQIAAITSVVQGIENSVENFWNRLSLADLAHPQQVFERIGNIIHDAITSIINFAVNAATELLAIVKRFLLNQLVSFIKDHTTAYPLLCVILGQDPVTDEHVDRNGTTILNALLELGGEEGREQRRQMQETGSFKKVADYIDRGIRIFGNAYTDIKAGIAHIWDYVSINSLMHPIDTFNEIYNTFAAPVRKVWDFVTEVGAAILRFIKEVLMVRLSAWARTQRGYFLVTVIIGEDPFTKANVPRNTENVIHGFMSLMEGGEEQFNQMKESGAIDRTTQRVNAAVERLNMTPESIIQLFIDLWHSFSLNDLIHPIEAFQRIIHRFGEPIARLIAFVIEIIKIVIDVIMQIMNFPTDLIRNIIAKAMLAIEMIKRDPIGFLKNLLKAIKEGFTQFFTNIVEHLIFGLTGWLMSELKDAGVPELKDTTLRGVITWILAVLDLSMETIWKKLAEHPKIGPQKVAKIRSVINTLEGIWTFIKDVQERGIEAIWDKIKEQLTNLWDTVLSSVKNWVMEQIVNKVTAKLLSMLDPTGIMAVINSAIALYKAIQSFIKYLREMLQVVNSFVEGVVEIASGNTARAANFLEGALHRAMPIVIGFLANQVGLGGIGHRIGELIVSARALVDEAITWLVNKAVDLGSKLLEMGKNAIAAVMDWWKAKKEFTLPNGEQHEIYVEGTAAAPLIMVASNNPKTIEQLIADGKPKVATDPVKTGLLAKAETDNNTLKDKIKTKKGEIEAAVEPQKTQKENELRQHILTELESIKESLKNGGALTAAEADLPVTPVPTYGGLDTGFATSMTIKPLTKLGITGSDVSADSQMYRDLLLRKENPDGRSFYVAGHLLNNNLHGDGSTWQNLTPITQTANGDHLRDVENPIKDEVTANSIMEYTVTVNYQDSAKTNQLLGEIRAQDPNYTGNPELDQKYKIISAEARLPRSFSCTARKLKKGANPGEYLPDKDIFVNKPVTSDIKQESLAVYYLKGGLGTTYKSLADLIAAAKTEAAKAGSSWDAFYKDINYRASIDKRIADDAANKGKIKEPFDQQRLFEFEKNKIEDIPVVPASIQNWESFQGNREAYRPDAINPNTHLKTLKKNFGTKMGRVKAELFRSAREMLGAVIATDKWNDFRKANNLYPRADILEQSELDTFKATYFDPKIASLRAAPAPGTAPAATPVPPTTP